MFTEEDNRETSRKRYFTSTMMTIVGLILFIRSFTVRRLVGLPRSKNSKRGNRCSHAFFLIQIKPQHQIDTQDRVKLVSCNTFNVNDRAYHQHGRRFFKEPSSCWIGGLFSMPMAKAVNAVNSHRLRWSRRRLQLMVLCCQH